MTLGIRKLIVVSLVGGAVLVANFLLVAHWLQRMFQSLLLDNSSMHK